MKYGDIIFFRGRSLVDRAIRLFDPGRFNHVAIILGNYKGRIMFLESSWGGVHASFLRPEEKNYKIIRLKRQPAVKQKDLLRLSGEHYGYTHIFWLAMNKLSFGFITPFDERGHLICSQLVNYAYGYRFGRQRTVTPNSIYRELRAKRKRHNKNN